MEQDRYADVSDQDGQFTDKVHLQDGRLAAAGTVLTLLSRNVCALGTCLPGGIVLVDAEYLVVQGLGWSILSNENVEMFLKFKGQPRDKEGLPD
jgi:hypothetical protein